MIKNEKLELLCKELAAKEPDWPKIVFRFNQQRGSIKNGGSLLFREYQKFFSEAHLDICLEDIAEKHPELNISFDPLNATKKRSGDWMLKYDRLGRMLAYKSCPNGYSSQEYDKVLLVDNLPTVFEIKLQAWKSKKGGIIDSFIDRSYNRKLMPIREAYNSDCGYVFIVPARVYTDRNEGPVLENTIWDRFRKNGGIPVPFYTDRQEFKWEVTQKVLENDLNKGLIPMISHLPLTLA